MRTTLLAALLIGTAMVPAVAADAEHVQAVEAWRTRVEKSLRQDNGWLTLAGRYVMKPGVNTFGTGASNAIVLPKGLGPERIGTIEVTPGKVTMKLAPGVTMTKDGVAFTEREMGTKTDNRDWVALGRATMHVIERDGKYILRLADNQSKVRESFGGRVWYAVDETYRVKAKFVPYAPGKKVPIVNVLDEVSDEPSPGYLEFTLNGKTQRLDVVGDDEGLFTIFRDDTAGKTTYRPGRFLYVEKKPAPNTEFMLDLNRAYNPPCAFSEFTTCPLPPEQNILKVRVEAGEKYPPKKAG
ncbi:DUF1684 domain-containing protein [Usitatibacter palustris]|uniref:DUF1684 domain-containing protein n=1 Tax=Usitatibacter palustris TaxID=2732487 RepID=A0A6M4H837_9PROT|nr:DUF1684 domain-containing protein [Usitatibacter palustris]QJR15740.1 hypothetical protein DSM104440_02566 [Usitatibacter palustris]